MVQQIRFTLTLFRNLVSDSLHGTLTELRDVGTYTIAGTLSAGGRYTTITYNGSNFTMHESRSGNQESDFRIWL
jgi:hypothetical protein